MKVKLNGRYRARDGRAAKCVAVMATEELFPCIIAYNDCLDECESVSSDGRFYSTDNELHSCDLVEELPEETLAKAVAKEAQFIAEHKETLIKAWLAQTGVMPAQSVLCVQQDQGVTRIWVESKDEQGQTST